MNTNEINEKNLLEELKAKLQFYNDILEYVPAIIYINEFTNYQFATKWTSRQLVDDLGFDKEVYEKNPQGYFVSQIVDEDVDIAAKSFQYLKKNPEAILHEAYRMKTQTNYDWYYGVFRMVKTDGKGDALGIGIILNLDKHLDETKGLEEALIQNYRLKYEHLVKLLTKKEKEIIALIARGKTSKQIADEQFNSVHTVDKHRRNMMKKLGFKKSTELAQFATEVGIQ